MPKKIQKTLQDYLTKIKTRHPPQLQLPFNSISSSKTWILSGCKHPKTPSFALPDRKSGGGSSSSNDNNNKEDVAATLADVDRFLLENFKSLYLKDHDSDDDHDDDDNNNNNNNKNTKRVFLEDHSRRDEEGKKLGPILFDSSPRLVEIPRDLCGSTRFFVKPGFSGSLMEDGNTSMTTTTFDHEEGDSTTTAITTNDSSSKEGGKAKLPDNCIALLTYTPSPYDEFRRSMQEMVEARARNNEGDIDWEFMEELLFCYLNLNEKKSHKFILSAFVDIATTMRSQNYSETANVASKPRSVRTFTIDRKVIKKF